MKITNILVFSILALTVGCSNPNSEFISKVKQQVKEDAMGVEMNYENIDFQWVDTLYVKQELATLKEQFDARLKTITDIEFYVKDNYKKGKIFTKEYLTKERFDELRNWEIKVGHPNQYSYGGQATWVEDGYKDYYEFAFANRDASPWISELCNQIEETDSLLNTYDNLQEGNLSLLQNVLWFYKRIDNFNSNNNPSDLWDKVDNELTALKEFKSKTDSLSYLDPNEVLHYKALNTYKINNPVLNGAEQEFKKYFIFNPQLEIIGKEEFEK
jgi:hypothetical protein